MASSNRRVYSRELFTSLRSFAAPLSLEVIHRLGSAAATWKSNKRSARQQPQHRLHPQPPSVAHVPVFEPSKGLVPVDQAWLKPHPLLGDLTGSLEGGIEQTPLEDSPPASSRGPSSPPPGFGPPSAAPPSIPASIPISIPFPTSIPAASPSSNIAGIYKSRIARGPNLSRNFASRIEFTNSNSNGRAAPPRSIVPPPFAAAQSPSDDIHRLFQSNNLIPQPVAATTPPFSTSLDSNHHVPIPSNSFNSLNSTALLEQWFQDISVAEKKANPVITPPSPPVPAKKKEPEQLSSNVLSFFNSVKAQATKKKSVPANSASKSQSSINSQKSIPSSPSPSPPSRVQLPIRQHISSDPLPKQQHTFPVHHHQPQQRVQQQEQKIDHGLAGFPHLGSSRPNRPTAPTSQNHPMVQQFHRPVQPSDLNNNDPRRVGLQRPVPPPPTRFNVPNGNGNHLQPGNPANQQQQHLFNLFANANASNSNQQRQHLKNGAPQLQAADHPMSRNTPLNATMFAPPPQAIYLQQLQANAARQPTPQQQQRHQFAAHMMHPSPPGATNMPQVQPVRIVAHPQFIQTGGAANTVPPGMMNKLGRPQQIPVPAVAGIASATVAAPAAPPHNPENVDSLQQWFHKLQQHQHHAPSS